MESKLHNGIVNGIKRVREVKCLSQEAKCLIIKLGKKWIGNQIECDLEQSNIIIKGFKTTSNPKNFKNNLRGAIARVMTNNFGFNKVKVGKERQEDRGRVVITERGGDMLIRLDFKRE